MKHHEHDLQISAFVWKTNNNHGPSFSSIVWPVSSHCTWLHHWDCLCVTVWETGEYSLFYRLLQLIHIKLNEAVRTVSTAVRTVTMIESSLEILRSSISPFVKVVPKLKSSQQVNDTWTTKLSGELKGTRSPKLGNEDLIITITAAACCGFL